MKRLFFITAALLLQTSMGLAQEVASGKRVLELQSVDRVRFQLPNDVWYEFGDDFHARLVTVLTQSGRFMVVDPLKSVDPALARENGASIAEGGDFNWSGTSTPAVRLRVGVKAASFVTGSRGTRAFYGFDENLENRYPNEFPIQKDAREYQWFGKTFEGRGDANFGSRAGLDLGEGFGLDVLFAFLKIKYVGYRSRLVLELETETPFSASIERTRIDVTGRGYYFDVAGRFAQYSLAVVMARTDALLKSFNRAMDQTSAKLAEQYREAHLAAQIDGVVSDGAQVYVLVGSGLFSEVEPGTRYIAVSRPGLQLEVVRSVKSGSIARVAQGDLSMVRTGMLLKEWRAGEVSTEGVGQVSSMAAASTSSRVENGSESASGSGTVTLDTGAWNLNKIDFKKLGVKEGSWFRRLMDKVAGMLVLPFRIARYFLYDQKFKGSTTVVADAPVVAVVDTGFDYNLNGTQTRTWINPLQSARNDKVGWDFISGDNRPYDDQGHGTRVATAMLKVLPSAKVMPVKVFDPWGHTSSNALYAGIRYAVDHGADVILLAWGTFNRSQALEDAIRYAGERGIPVVASAGNEGQDIGSLDYYPASFSRQFRNVLSVAAVDGADQLLIGEGSASNYGADAVQVAALGVGVDALNPRGKRSSETGADMAAARVAARLAQIRFESRSEGAEVAIKRLLQLAEPIEALRPYVRDGLVLRF